MNNKSKLTKMITQGAAIGALYVVLTLLANAFGLANYAIQVRFSEALTILPLITFTAVPGLFVGCIISNILTGAMALDVVFGSIATLIGAIGTYYCRKFKCKYIGALPPIIANTIIVPLVLKNVYKFEGSLGFFMLTVGIGEIISCGILGCILYKTISKRSDLFADNEQ